MKFKVQAVETNIHVYPPIFSGNIYEVVDVIKYNSPIPGVDLDYYVLETEEYDQGIVWGMPPTTTKRYNLPAYLFKKLESDKPKCTCGQNNTWIHFHKRECPSDKHSDWCEVYKK